MKRRDFILAAGLGAANLTIPAFGQSSSPRPRTRGDASFYIDAQGVIGPLDGGGDGVSLEQQLKKAIAERRIDVISQTLMPVGNVPNGFRLATEEIAKRDAVISDKFARSIMKVQSVADIRKARDAGKIGLIYNLQDSTAHEGNSGNVRKLAALGVKVMQLTYNKRNLAGDGCLERSNAGLSDYGRELIVKINEADVLLDLSHSGQLTTAEGIAASKAPPTITHSGCRALVDNPRNTFDAEMRAIADKGGVFGVYLMPFLRAKGPPGPEDLLRHIEHAVNICGEDHVGLGTDNVLSGRVIDDEMRKQHREYFEQRQKAGIAAPGEAADVLYLVESYNDVTRFDRIGADLRKRGWSSARVEKVLGGNFLRLFGDVWKG
jgi:membrane dipeptidase